MNQSATQTRFWLLALGIFVFLLWLLKSILLPFVAGLVLAYFFNPVVNVLTRHKFPRWLATVLVLLTFIILAIFLALLILPMLQSQLAALIAALPGYVVKFREQLIPWAKHWLESLSPENETRVREAAGQIAGNAAGWIGSLLKDILSEGTALFNALALIIVTPVVAFFILRDWPSLAKTMEKLLPRKHQELIMEVLKEIDRALSGWVRGQALVCLCLGLIYSIGLSLVGLKYGATIGIIAGILSFIPYVGSGFMLIASMLLAFIQFDSYIDIGQVFLVYAIGQVLEGYVLTPKLVGDRIGLHPVWVIFALFAGGSLLGFLGVLIAVPVAAIIGVLIRLGLRLYRLGPFYHGIHNKSSHIFPNKNE